MPTRLGGGGNIIEGVTSLVGAGPPVKLLRGIGTSWSNNDGDSWWAREESTAGFLGIAGGACFGGFAVEGWDDIGISGAPFRGATRGGTTDFRLTGSRGAGSLCGSNGRSVGLNGGGSFRGPIFDGAMEIMLLEFEIGLLRSCSSSP